ncbi:DNA polymerase III subunit gamma/tau [Prosthecomicrobium pneumaticum]|uniref:DNA polymerase III subunit gamma/tau n=1 Tax=Prosthecomicrobium pneumaticum TaxID=81895 RepID=A0A7W9FM31_9HYPH|nr:DNA polymerase III subunit gamma/tau [Prosthecomicrobium pneumaticum]MBB5753178.1 DNA polymerase-3 subunit gamma/tau [Prosthecomicrobium pneumaticum]
MAGAGSARGGAYRVLARKYRPRSFDDLIGQEPMVRTLKNAFETGRIAQAYMLTGVRGVGKTTTARILARALNYELPGRVSAPTIDMPELGVHCAEIMEGRHVDVIEMDAASHTGVGDIREIIEAVRYRPVSARYKVYILDEVHMLSGAAFNALLKTLEEPPEHVKFVFATTEIRKVPITVLSRCQRFDLRRIEAATLIGLLGRVAEAEGIAIEPEALAMIARAGEGSARDSLSILDQAIAHGAGADDPLVRAEEVRAMLGLADRARVVDLFEAVMAGRTAEALALLKAQYDVGAEPAVVLQDLAAFTHFVTRLKIVPEAADDPAVPEEERRRGAAFAERLSLRVLSRAWQMLLKGIDEVQGASRPLAAADMVLVRIAHAADLPTPDEALRLLKEGAFRSAASASVPGGSAPGSAASEPPPAPRLSAVAAPMRAEIAAPAPVPSPQPAPQARQEPAIRFSRWEDLVAFVGTKRDVPLKISLERHARPMRLEQGLIEFEPVGDPPSGLASELARKLSDWTGERWTAVLGRGATSRTLDEAKAAQQEKNVADARSDPLVAAVLARFPGARIVDVRVHAADEVAAALPSPDATVDIVDEIEDATED